MAQPNVLSVELEELRARANLLETPVPGLPTESPVPACALEMALDANAILTYDGNAMRTQIIQFEKERMRLAQSLRNAADTYELIDKGSADAIDSNAATMASVAASAGGEMMSINCDPDPWETYPEAPPQPPAPEPIPYVEVRQAAQQIAAPDQGDSLQRYANSWTDQQQTLLEATKRFATFQQWEGDAALALEAHFELYRQWLISMAQLCSSLAVQARNLRATHRTAFAEHPTVTQLQDVDDLWVKYSQTDYWDEAKPWLLSMYAEYQAKSEEVLAKYAMSAGLPLSPMNPPKPPSAIRIDPPPVMPPLPEPTDPVPEDPIPDEPEDDEPGLPDLPEIPDFPTPPDEPDTPGDDPHMPHDPDVPDEPDLPDIPDFPTPPDEPDTPGDDPHMPHDPDVPDEPDLPDVPDDPDLPDVPDFPLPPDEPDTPGDSPDVPDLPDNPDAPGDPDLPGEDPDTPGDDEPWTPEVPETPEEDDPSDDDLFDDDDLTTVPPTTTPQMPLTDTGSPSDADLKSALEALSNASGFEPALEPASFGGGAGGAPGIPSMPLQPAVSPESATGLGTGAARDAANIGRGLPGPGNPMGMAPMAPMMPGTQGQGNNSAKRGPKGDEAMYEEERPWTEGVIGNRRRKDSPTNKE